MRAVIYGLSKTGTTALYFKLKNSFPKNTICLFEPEAQGLIGRVRTRIVSARAVSGARHVLAKVLPFRASRPDIAAFGSFDKQILILRDPRDRLVSSVLYQVYNSDFFAREEAVARFILLLRRKEQDPANVSLISIMETYEELAGNSFGLAAWAENYGERGIRQPLAFHDARRELYPFRYEDMVEGRFAGLEAYLGTALPGSSAVDEGFRRVARTRRAGGWRDWFTPDDVRSIGPILQPYLDRYYPEADWQLHDRPQIEPEHGSGYVIGIVNERRATARLAPLLSLA